MIDANNIKKHIFLMFFMAAFFGVFGPLTLECSWWWYLFLVVVVFCFSLYLIYYCERFVVFFAAILSAAIFTFPYISSSLAYLIASDSFGKGDPRSVVIGTAPITIVFLMFLVIFYSKSSFFPFECVGNRVTARPKKIVNSKSYNLGLISGVSTLTGSMFLKSVGAETGGMVALVICAGCSVIILFYLRHSIRGLRTLHIRERKMPTPYTFMQIDEIREARSRWWLGRLFKWMGSLRQSTGS
ncbi:hypothetical protein PMI26_05115 [Pseudomonas sp. GM33]|uniref:hypothetical protein n=1 Tax=Pseudomonas sp. GM33 TaxID=1144329 RepID=UPI00026FF1CD|nr:hypothetical protein [Pseudomonas sp. GM33]EJM36883.1 hypothetical protein PMI26_05115 [Pseudomonas sp. GM33]MDP9657927.1 hypothetical protein [Pseudomonas putida]